ncbi:unnamed protein product [Rotaria sordida]|uniref:FAD-binding domain-containing protein n=1 Tax=Rotaria sordida TaxID=392033 RepID=A0A813Z774_9BILA|nr:unnamed protein product [Rotaria sordida]CAF1224373.1 unnamed protein product [Rotaria sordida]
MKSTSSEILDYHCRLESPTSLGRSGVSQIYQGHALQSEGYKILLKLFPQLKDKLFNEYDVRAYSMKTEARLMAEGVFVNQNLTEDVDWFGVDRFTFEIILRKELRLKFDDQIEWKCNTRVMGLIVDQSLNIVKGIKYRSKKNIDSSSFDMYGDFIIDCTGRNTSSPKWLKESFNLIVPTIQIHFGFANVTFIGERFRTGDLSLDSATVIGTTVNPPHKNVGFLASPIRILKTIDDSSLGTMTVFSINCVNSEYPPNDSYENLLEWVKENLDIEYYTILKQVKVYSQLIPYRRAIDDRKYVELLGKKWPQNYILLGDAMCTFNPLYGQGMTHAFRHARELGKIFGESCHKLKDISHIFNRRASVITEECWLASTANDWRTPTLKVIETNKNGDVKIYQRDSDSATTNYPQPRIPLMIRFMQWYSHWLLQCASKSGQLATDFIRVVTQQSNPLILMKPTTFFAVIHIALMNYLKDWGLFGGRSARNTF